MEYQLNSFQLGTPKLIVVYKVFVCGTDSFRGLSRYIPWPMIFIEIAQNTQNACTYRELLRLHCNGCAYFRNGVTCLKNTKKKKNKTNEIQKKQTKQNQSQQASFYRFIFPHYTFFITSVFI